MTSTTRREDAVHGDLMCEVADGIAVVTLNRPESLNPWTRELGARLGTMLQELEEDPDVRAYVITGAGGRSFCAGADIKDPNEHKVTSAAEFLDDRPVAPPHYIVGLRKPIVAAVNGYAIGAGFLLAIACDVVVGSPAAKFALTQTKLGIFPAQQGATRLAQWVGRGRAMEIALTGRFVPAEEAHAIGIITAIHPPESLLDEAVALASQLGALPPAAVALTKESMAAGLETPMIQQLESDGYRYMALAMLPETAERHEDWRQRRH